MGFLLGMAGKLAAGQRVRTLQAKMMRVQSQLRRVTREYSDMEKYINSMKNAKLNEIRQTGSMFQQGLYMANQTIGLAEYFAENGGAEFLSSNGQLNQTAIQANGALYNSILQGYNAQNSISANAFSQVNQQIQAFMQMEQANVENYVEMLKETQLEPLKDTEDDLQLEKDSLESEIQLAQQDYEACKEMEKAGAKNLKPDYTGQG